MKTIGWREVIGLLGSAAILLLLIAVTVELRKTQAALGAAIYQARASDAVAEYQFIGESGRLLPLLVQTEFAADAQAVARLSETDQMRLRMLLLAKMTALDNEHYQYQKGFVSEADFERNTVSMIRRLAPRWRALGITEGREAFRVLVDRVTASEDDAGP